MGGRHIVLRKVDGAEILRRVDEHGVTLLCGAPAVVAAILDAAASWDGEVPGRGRTRMVVAGAPPPTRTIERVETELGWEFIQIYGLTETAPLLTMNRGREEYDALTPGERASRLGRAGAPSLGVRLRVDAEGEVLARSNVVMEGYWEQPDETDAAIRDGWFHTGDGGFIDDENYLTIADRKKDVIISGGENVSSIEVEDCIFSHPAVAEVAVIGVPAREVGRDGDRARGRLAPGDDHRGRDHRALPRTPRALQVPDRGRVPRRARAHRDRQAPEVQAARALLGRPRPARQLAVRRPEARRTMPEGDTIHRSAVRLHAAIAGKRITAIEIRRNPRGRRAPEPGTMVEDVPRAASICSSGSVTVRCCTRTCR